MSLMNLLKFVFTADNKTGGAIAGLKGDLKGVKGALAGITDQANRAGKSMQRMGLKASVGVTAPLAALGRQSVKLFDEQAKAEAAVRQAIEATGGAAGKTADELFRAASGLQRMSLSGDEDILGNLTAQLLTFKNVSGDTFDRAQQSILDLSVGMKKDLRSSAIQVGKALNDPVRGLDSLSKSGVTFSDQQRDVIRAMTEVGDVAGAQALILRELESQFAGQAAAAAGAGTGPLEQLTMATGDLKEELGEQIVTFFPAVLEAAWGLVDALQGLSPEAKKNIVVFGGLAAAAGPVLALLGTATLGVTALATGLTGLAGILLANPITAGLALIAGGAFLIYRNWDGIKAWFAARWEGVKGVFGAFWRWAEPLLAKFSPAYMIYKNWDTIGDWFSDKMAAVFLAIDDGWDTIRSILAGDYSPQKLIFDAWQGIAGWFAGLGGNVAAAFRTIWEMIKAEVAEWPGRMIQFGRDVINGLIEGIGLQSKSTSSAIRKEMRALRGAAEDELGIQSPSKVFAEIGRDVMRGLGLGLREERDAALGEIKDLTDNLGDAASKGPDIESMFASTFSSVTRNIDGARDAAARFVDQLADIALQSAGRSVFKGFGLDALFSGLFAANGAAFGSSGQIQPFAKGGVVGRATGFGIAGGGLGVMGEAGPEAIMPLKRGPGGRLGVEAQMPRVTSAPSREVRQMARAEYSKTITFNASIDVSGARGDREIEETARRGAERAIAAARPGLIRDSVSAVADINADSPATLNL